MLEPTDFIILFLSQFLAFTLALNAVLWLFMRKFNGQLKQFITNDMIHAVAPVVVEMGQAMGQGMGEKIWRQERSQKAVTAKADKKELTDTLSPVLGDAAGPILNEVIKIIPKQFQGMATQWIAKNPEMVQGLLAKLGGMTGGTQNSPASTPARPPTQLTKLQ